MTNRHTMCFICCFKCISQWIQCLLFKGYLTKWICRYRVTKWFHGYTDTYINVVTEYPHIHISTHFRAYFKIHVAGLVHVLISAVKTSLLISNCTAHVDLNLIKKSVHVHSLAFIFCRFLLCKEFDVVLQSQFLGNQPLTKSSHNGSNKQ